MEPVQQDAAPHLLWEGIDGTRVFTHFPPVDTYNAEFKASELAHGRAQLRRQGGWRPARWCPSATATAVAARTREMLEKARRLASLEGSPTVQI
ncbi:hypothetical protein TPA0910_00020 [Streptomyces hygroscopicus subsp. sporocinereus]|uniref:Glycoside hydrolase family 38 N-terminal domain-containing protein n=1 Tax=Streptomyces hygroscopicus TaxID=1912 RepID=A0ABQ3TQE5_STRHY|nr:hypothetical protein TPA0910_00020 [Streptomyces hygroscopicus]